MSTGPQAAIRVPDYLRALVDDAAIFPPGNSPLPAAVAAHRDHRAASYAELLGSFVISDVRLAELLQGATGSTSDPLPVTVVVQGGAGAIGPAVAWATGSDALDLRSIEIALRGSDTGDLPHNARRIVTALDQLVADGALGDEVTVYVEAPRQYGAEPGHGWLAALDEIAAANHRLKFRTGGAETDDFPSADELAASIAAALDRELRFKCTAGLHNALRHRDEETRLEHHGFLNVLLATRASLDGASRTEVSGVLEMADPDAVSRLVADAEDGLAGARPWFTSFGSCSVLEPLEDLIALDLLPASLTGSLERV